jgi:Protease inhibitor Inh
MTRLALIWLVAIGNVGTALAQAPPAPTLGDSAKAVIGTWEFSSADRDKTCTATFRNEKTTVGFNVEFDQNCANLFPLVADIAGWIFPDNDLLRLLDAQGKTLVEFSEVEDGIYEAPTPGVGVLFLQNAAAAAGPVQTSPEEMAGSWMLMRGAGAPLCALTLASTAMRDGLALTVKPGCAPSIAQLNFTQWQLDRGELVLVTERGSSWRFEEIDNVTWRRIPESANQITLVRQ